MGNSHIERHQRQALNGPSGTQYHTEDLQVVWSRAFTVLNLLILGNEWNITCSEAPNNSHLVAVVAIPSLATIVPTRIGTWRLFTKRWGTKLVDYLAWTIEKEKTRLTCIRSSCPDISLSGPDEARWITASELAETARESRNINHLVLALLFLLHISSINEYLAECTPYEGKTVQRLCTWVIISGLWQRPLLLPRTAAHWTAWIPTAIKDNAELWKAQFEFEFEFKFTKQCIT